MQQMSKAAAVSLGSVLRLQFYLVGGFLLGGLILFGLIRVFSPGSVLSAPLSSFQTILAGKFLYFLAVGFVAQLIDGALGMAYGVTSTSLLLSAGVSPSVASASVHAAEVFTTGAAGISHWKFGNVRNDLFVKLAIPGAAGAALGAYVLTSFDGNVIRPYLAVYLLLMGVIILLKAVGKTNSVRELKHIRLLAVFGGFVDASGGGGWGPVVTSTLISGGHQTRPTIGTTNAVEFLVAMTAAGVFSLFVGFAGWQVVLGLILGGVLAAPLGAYACHKINPRACMLLVGCLIVILSVRTLILSIQ
jgi:uncharacterized membrane protein YfcA